MKKTLIIALREFSTTVLRRGFVLTLIAMPLFFVVVPGVLIYLMNSGPGPAKGRQPAALIDNAGIISPELLDETLVKDAPFTKYDDLQQALFDLRNGRVSGCYVIEHDYLETGNVTSYAQEGGLFSSLLSQQSDALDDILRFSL